MRTISRASPSTSPRGRAVLSAVRSFRSTVGWPRRPKGRRTVRQDLSVPTSRTSNGGAAYAAPFWTLNYQDRWTATLRRQSGLDSRFVQDLVWVRRLYDYQQQQAGQQVGCHNKIGAEERVAGRRSNIAGEGRCDSRAEIAEAADEGDAAGGARPGQVLGDGGEDQWRRRNESEAGECQAYNRCHQIAVGKCDGQQADCPDGHAGDVVPPPFPGLVRVTPHQNCADDTRDLRQGGKQAYVQQI